MEGDYLNINGTTTPQREGSDGGCGGNDGYGFSLLVVVVVTIVMVVLVC